MYSTKSITTVRCRYVSNYHCRIRPEGILYEAERAERDMLSIGKFLVNFRKMQIMSPEASIDCQTASKIIWWPGSAQTRCESSVLLKAAPVAPAPTNNIDGFQCLLCANKYTYIHHVCLVPGTCACVSCSVVCSNTSALSNGCSPHVRSTLMFLGWLGFSSNG